MSWSTSHMALMLLHWNKRQIGPSYKSKVLNPAPEYPAPAPELAPATIFHKLVALKMNYC